MDQDTPQTPDTPSEPHLTQEATAASQEPVGATNTPPAEGEIVSPPMAAEPVAAGD